MPSALDPAFCLFLPLSHHHTLFSSSLGSLAIAISPVLVPQRGLIDVILLSSCPLWCCFLLYSAIVCFPFRFCQFMYVVLTTLAQGSFLGKLAERFEVFFKPCKGSSILFFYFFIFGFIFIPIFSSPPIPCRKLCKKNLVSDFSLYPSLFVFYRTH